MSVTKGYSTTFAYGDISATPSYTTIAGVTEITPPKISAAKIDTTNFTSADEFKEQEPGLKESDDVEATLQFEKTQSATLYGLLATKKAFKVQFADGSKWEFNGFISGFGDAVDREGIVTTTVTIAVTGKPTFTAASGS